jgi:hypothetical protein
MNMLNAMPRNSRGAAVGHEGDGQPLSKAHVQPPQRDAVDFGSGGILRLDSLVAFDGTYLRASPNDPGFATCAATSSLSGHPCHDYV